MSELETFEKIISQFSKNAKVLDMGAFGHAGENTSVFLAKHFDSFTGFNINVKALETATPNCKMIINNFYDHDFNGEKFDVIVLDATIELNLLNDWCDEGLRRAYNLLNEDGHLIIFVMMTDQYGDPAVTPALIRWHSQKWWGTEVPTQESVGAKLSTLKDWTLNVATPEIRRPYILWVDLIKK